jgi:hypothetical protein
MADPPETPGSLKAVKLWRFEVLTAVSPENGESVFHRNFGICF